MIKKFRELDKLEKQEAISLINECEYFDNASTCIKLANNFNKEMFSFLLLYENESLPADKHHSVENKNLNSNKNELCGISTIFTPTKNQAEIAMCIKPNKRRKGFATRLLKETKDEIRENSISNILITVDNNSESGKKFIFDSNFILTNKEFTFKYDNEYRDIKEKRMLIHEAKKEDLEYITQLLINAFADDYWETRNIVELNFISKDRKIYVGFLEEKIITTCFVYYQDNQIYLNSVATLKNFQNYGYAKELLLSIINKESKKDIFIDVDINNNKACNLYKKIGFNYIKSINYYIC
jgi:ribosomal protein S18 acetylase RimI-like enzyme